MKVLTINCGSSTLKFRLLETFPIAPNRERWLARGIVDRIGTRRTLEFTQRYLFVPLAELSNWPPGTPGNP
jgi:acetate kinase